MDPRSSRSLTVEDAEAFLDSLGWASDTDGYRDLVSPVDPPDDLLVWNVSSSGERTRSPGGTTFYPGRNRTLFGWSASSDSHTLVVELGGVSRTFTEPKPW